MICGLRRRFSEQHLSCKCEDLSLIPRTQRGLGTAAHTYNPGTPMVKQEAEAGGYPQAYGPVSLADAVARPGLKQDGRQGPTLGVVL